jgi:hypothetical protein
MTTVDEFASTLERLPLLEHLGKPSSRDGEVFRIYAWDTWPGPEDPGSEAQALYHALWRDKLFEGLNPGRADSR